MENRDLERTEELLKKGGKKKKTPLIIAVVVLALVAALIGGLAVTKAQKDKELTKNLDQAEKYMQEGDYEQAAAAYTAAIGIDDRNVPAYRGRAKANAGLGKTDEAFSDIDKAIELEPEDMDTYSSGIEIAMNAGNDEKVDEYIEKLHENIEGTEDITRGSLLLGADPSDISNAGLMLADGDTVYTASRDSIKVIEDGKESDPLVSGLKEDDKDLFITGLNKKDDYIYFMANVSMDGLFLHESGLYYGKSIYRVKADGSGEAEKIFTLDWDPKNYYAGLPSTTFPAGDYPYYMTQQLAVIGDRIYFNQYMRDLGTRAAYKVHSVSLDGKDKKDIGLYTFGSFASDGENIFCTPDNIKIMKYSIADAKTAELCSPGDSSKMWLIGNHRGQLVYSGGKIYYACATSKGAAVCTADAGTGEAATVYEADRMEGAVRYGADGDVTPTTVLAVKDGKIYFTSAAESGLPSTADIKCTVSSIDAGGGSPEEFAVIEHDFTDDVMISTPEYSMVELAGLAVNGDEALYSLCGISSDMMNVIYSYAFR